jgi:threonine dehydrogenase-like Zn-dependent dehydrogenase
VGDRVVAPFPLDEAPLGYDMFLHKRDDCVKVVLKT